VANWKSSEGIPIHGAVREKGVKEGRRNLVRGSQWGGPDAKSFGDQQKNSGYLGGCWGALGVQA
jgi:hypothetical protein